MDITILILPKGDELDIEVEGGYLTGAELIEELILASILDRSERFQLKLERTNALIEHHQSLLEAGLKDGDKILLYPELKTGMTSSETSFRHGPESDQMGLIIRILPQGDELDIELPKATTPTELIEALFVQEHISRRDSHGNPLVLELIHYKQNQVLQPNEALAMQGVVNGDILLIVPKLVAGGFDGKISYQLPTTIQFERKSVCTVRIGHKELADYLMKEGFSTEAEVHSLRINKVMRVTLEEHALTRHLIIKPVNSEEQIIFEGEFTEWQFYLTGQRLGVTSVLLRVTMPVIIEGFGERVKDVFLVDQEVEITPEESEINYQALDRIESLFEWTESLRTEVYDLIAQSEVGKALAKLITFFQKSDLELFNAVLLLQSRWNEGCNQHRNGLIPVHDWMIIHNRVVYSLLELVQNINQNRNALQDNRNAIDQIEEQLKHIQ